LIKTPKPLPKGEKFSLRLQLPDNPDPLNIECEVAWSRTQSDDPVHQPLGMGVKFIQISSADKKKLDQEIKKVIPAIKS